jgi:hypothetical protein
MKLAIVLDKSFLQAAPSSRMHQLAKEHRLLVTDALFYELLSNGDDRAICFAKFPKVDNLVDLVMHVGGYLKKEIVTRKPAPRPSESIVKDRFQFNVALLDKDYELPEESLRALRDKKLEVEHDMLALIALAKRMPTWFPTVFSGSQAERDAARAGAKNRIARDGDALLDFYGSIRTPKGMRRFPPKQYLNETWALFRWFQVKMLFALDLAFRQLGNLTENLSDNLHEKIEHDALDMEYLITGAIQGAFATNEKKLKDWFLLVCPTGKLYTHDA